MSKNHLLDIVSSKLEFAAGYTFLVILFMLFYQIILIMTSKIDLRDYSIFPKQLVSFVVDKTFNETKDIIENILPNKLKSNGFQYDDKNNLFKTKTAASLISLGENIEIKVTELENAKSQISVFSKPVLRTTLVDYGKSSLNIQKIKLALN